MLGVGTLAHAAAPSKVLLMPFESVGEGEKAWVAKAVQQNLVAELSRVSSVQPVTAGDPARDLDAAVKAAQEAKADYVVFGSYQAVEGDLRMTGQVVDVAKKQAVAGLKATGSQRDLFGMEDVIANQVKRALPQPVAVAAPQQEMLKQPPAAPPVVEPTGPVVQDPRQRTKELEAALDRTIERLRYAPPYEYGYPSSYVYSGIYTPYYPVYYYYPRRHWGHHHHHGGHWNGGGWHHGHNSGGGRVSTAIGYPKPAGSNYATFPRMTVQPVRR
jgi:TolB-like protein